MTTDECCITRTPTSCLSVAVRRNPAIQNWPYQLHAVLLEQSLTVIKEGSLLMPLLSSGYVDGIAGVARSKAVLARPWQTAQERISVCLVRLLPANPAFCQNNSLGLLRRLAAGCWLLAAGCMCCEGSGTASTSLGRIPNLEVVATMRLCDKSCGCHHSRPGVRHKSGGRRYGTGAPGHNFVHVCAHEVTRQVQNRRRLLTDQVALLPPTSPVQSSRL